MMATLLETPDVFAESDGVEMDWVKLAISDLVIKRERLKSQIESWYATPHQGSCPQWLELEQLDRDLSDLDSRFKRLWDARYR